MAFDIFVGSFTRYIGGDWENLGQRAAREQGIPYKIIRDNETEEAPPPTEEITATVSEWRDALNLGLRDQLKAPLAWDETKDTPYVTDRPDWAGYASLLLWAAYEDAPELKKPKSLPEEWGDDEAYKRATGEESETKYPAVLMANLWLPGEFDFMFGIEDLGGNPRAVASTAALHEELTLLNERTWKADKKALAEWRKQTPGEGASFEENAKFGLAVMLAMVEEARRLNVPMMPDY